MTLSEARRESLAAVLETLVPGGCGFPPASEIRLATAVELAPRRSTVDVIAALIERLNGRAGPGGLAGASTARRVELLRQAESSDPAFATLLRTAYLCYYAQPAVVEKLRLAGHDVNDAPQPRGYAMEPFEESMLPRQPRGSYVSTKAVVRKQLPEGIA